MTVRAEARPYSLKTQLLLWLLAPLFVISAVALADTWNSARQTANDILDRVLSGSVLAIAERVVVGENGELEIDIPYVALEMLTSSAQDRVFYRVDRLGGDFVTGYKELSVPADAQPPLSGFVFGDGRFLDSDIRFAAYASAASTGLESIAFRVTVAETTNARVALAQSIFLRSLVRQALLIVVAPIVVWVAVTRALRPVTSLREAIGRRSPEDLRPIARPVPVEMEGLLDTTNSFLARLNSAIGALRHFTGNASHQLRTPLAIIRTELALGRRAETLDDARFHAAEADRAAVQADRVLAQLLLLARIDEASSGSVMGAAADLAAVARAIVTDRVRAADQKGVDLGYEGEDAVPCGGDELLISELLRNLVENAMAYAGEGAVVTVRALLRDGAPVLEVQDNGPGIPDALKSKVLERFDRGAARDGHGAGLGLSVVKEIAELHGGTLTLSDAPSGGLLASVRFQRPASG